MGGRRPRPGRDARNLACAISPLPDVDRIASCRQWSAHEWLALDLDCFLIALLGAQRIADQPPRLSLRAVIAACERKCLAPAALSLMCVALRAPQPTKLYPYRG